MAALTDNKDRNVQNPEQIFAPIHLNVNAATTIFEGAIVYMDAVTGRATDISNGTANRCVGVARNNYVSTVGASTDFPLIVEQGQIEYFILAGVVNLDLGKTVYSANTADLTLVLGANVRLGILHEIVNGSGTTVRIKVVPNP